MHSLLLRPASSLEWHQLVGFFEGRAGYTSGRKVAAYSNPDTGAAFTLTRNASALVLSVGCGLPRFFGLEAAAELRALSGRLLVEMHDETGWRPLDAEVFFKSWSVANEAASKSLIRSTVEKLDRIWRWNFTARAREAATGWHVPRIVLARDEQPTSVVKLDSRPCLLPQCDFFALADEHTGWLDACPVEGCLEPLVAGDWVSVDGLPSFRRVGNLARPEVTKRRLVELANRSRQQSLRTVPFDAVLDAA